MSILYRFSTYFLLLLFLLTGACKKEEAEPQTGSLVINFKFDQSLSNASYSLYTEQIYSGPRSAVPLRQGRLGAFTLSSTNAQVRFDDLNAGNYVFVISSNTWSVQVTAGQTNTVFK